MSIKVLYLPENFYTSPKQISGYVSGGVSCVQNGDVKELLIDPEMSMDWIHPWIGLDLVR